jgi:uncharacterized membrane protein required for colicin V production
MLILDILKRFNWVDFFVLIILFRIIYVAIRNGFPLELFKLLGIIFSIYLALHYYVNAGEFLRVMLGIKKAPLEPLYFTAFFILAILGYLVFIFLRSMLYHFIKMEAVPTLDKWGGFILGIIRGVFTASLVICMLVISNIDYFKNSVADSYSGSYLLRIAPQVYAKIWNGITSKFMANEKFNQAVLRIETGPNK